MTDCSYLLLLCSPIEGCLHCIRVHSLSMISSPFILNKSFSTFLGPGLLPFSLSCQLGLRWRGRDSPQQRKRKTFSSLRQSTGHPWAKWMFTPPPTPRLQSELHTWEWCGAWSCGSGQQVLQVMVIALWWQSEDLHCGDNSYNHQLVTIAANAEGNGRLPSYIAKTPNKKKESLGESEYAIARCWSTCQGCKPCRPEA